MHIDRLKYFLDLTKTFNYTETAEHFFTTQSNISKQIIALEKELNTLLFSRKNRVIQLTEGGKTLIPYAERILSDYSELQNALLPFNKDHLEQQLLKIAAIPVMVNYNIPGLIMEFHHKHPHIALDIKETESINILSELNQGLCDLAYMRLFDLNMHKYEKMTIEEDYFAAILPANHPLAKREMLQLTQLKDEVFLQLDKNTQLFNLFNTLCEKEHFEPHIGYTGTHIYTILDFVSKGIGISIMMKNAVKSFSHPGIVIVPLNVTLKSELAFVRLKNAKHSPASNYFWRFLSHTLLSK